MLTERLRFAIVSEMKSYNILAETINEDGSREVLLIATTTELAQFHADIGAARAPKPKVQPNPHFTKLHAPGRPGEKVIVSPLGKTDVAGFAPGTEFVSATHATKELRSRGLIAEAKYNYVYLKLKEAVTKKDPAERLAFVEGIAFQYERDAVAAVTRD